MLLRVTCAALLFCAARAKAQESRGTIGGRVVDAHEAAVPRAAIVITNVNTGVSASILTNEQGAYVAPLLIPGTYRIAASREGFKKHSQTGVQLGVNDNLQIDIRMEIGE